MVILYLFFILVVLILYRFFYFYIYIFRLIYVDYSFDISGGEIILGIYLNDL